jgi:hypothetical protein
MVKQLKHKTASRFVFFMLAPVFFCSQQSLSEQTMNRTKDVVSGRKKCKEYAGLTGNCLLMRRPCLDAARSGKKWFSIALNLGRLSQVCARLT